MRIDLGLVHGALLVLELVVAATRGVAAKNAGCYDYIYERTEWTDNRPLFAVNMSFLPNLRVVSTTTVTEDILNPIAKVCVTRREGKIKFSTLYNTTTRLCEIQGMFKKLPMFKDKLEGIMKSGNYSFACPMKPGVYVMDSARLKNPNSPLFNYLIRPKTAIIFAGGMFDELANKSLVPLSTYNFTIKSVKKSCNKNAK